MSAELSNMKFKCLYFLGLQRNDDTDEALLTVSRLLSVCVCIIKF
jgi:hypothetical protein